MGALTGLWWWIDRWRKSTAFTEMNLEEQGAYRNLLDEARLRGGLIPDDDELLAKACGDPRRWKVVKKKVMRWFVRDGRTGGWRNVTLDEILAESDRRSEKQRAYRNRQHTGNAVGNASGNATGRGAVTALVSERSPRR